MNENIPFNKPFLTGREIARIEDALRGGKLSGDGPYTTACSKFIEEKTGAKKALLTHSGTAALEMAVILAGIQPGDEVILPSYTFVSTATAFVLRGAIPVFCDVRADTLNIDEAKIEELITKKTRAIVPVHYAGVSCEMNKILDLADSYGLAIIEDAAQGIMSTYHGSHLGSIGNYGCYSFHETKNIISGEGGALLLREEKDIERAEIIIEKGTNRSRFLIGQVDKYTWVDVGSSYLPSEMVAAFLMAQLERADWITKRRLELWDIYYRDLDVLEAQGLVKLPIIPEGCVHNGHIFYLLLPSLEVRTKFIEKMKEAGIGCHFHYQSLHSSPYGLRVGKTPSPMEVTERASDCLVRLPLWVGLESHIDRVISQTIRTIKSLV